ncbi:hypothetical protein [Actinomycetospora callitridis]|uniref:hypothetical protein n=1 Tax=Actinomycetospora callitridis TaxID=913944 RepID=UPI00236693F1|nr:hypothetical protein [Actinomycetospora callitridis]MDD7919770.1 hypothetical protein [Actinomycetospora callitridis]
MTRAPGPAAREPDGARLTHVPTTVAPRGPADAPTVALPVVRPGAAPPTVGRAAPAVPEVPAIADLAAPGRPDVEAVVADDEPAPRRPRPSRHMRARADEMAHLLARATPSSRTRRGLSSLSFLPAVAAVMGAVAVGGVGIALGLDAQRTGVALPDMPDVPAEQTPVPETGEGTGTAGAVSPTVNTGVVEALEPDAGGARVASPSSVAAEAARPAPAGPPRATTPTSRPRSTPSPTPSTRAEPTTVTSSPTPRSTSPRPTTRSDGADESDRGSAAAERGLDGLEDGPGTRSTSDGEDATAG